MTDTVAEKERTTSEATADGTNSPFEQLKVLRGKVTTLQLDGKFLEAKHMQEESLLLMKKAYGDEAPQIALNLARLGSILEAIENVSVEDIETIYRKSLTIYRKCRRQVRANIRKCGEGKDERVSSSLFATDQGVESNLVYFDSAIAEVLSSLANVVNRDKARSAEADAIHKMSLGIFANVIRAESEA